VGEVTPQELAGFGCCLNVQTTIRKAGLCEDNRGLPAPADYLNHRVRIGPDSALPRAIQPGMPVIPASLVLIGWSRLP
jgi:hypothetical protein